MPDGGRPPRGAGLGAVLLLGLVLAGGAAGAQGLAGCAPLQGTPSYQPCVADQQRLQRQDLLAGPRASPRPTARPDYLFTDPDPALPPLDEDWTGKAARDVDAAQSNSTLRSNALRQQIQRDLRNGIGAAPPLRPVAPMTIP